MRFWCARYYQASQHPLSFQCCTRPGFSLKTLQIQKQIAETVEMSPTDSPFDVAIVGGGIVGLSLALGLLQRNIKFKIYERAHGFGEIGAGIGFTPNAERAMKLLDPRLHGAFRKVAARNSEDYFNYVDGYRWDQSRPDHEEIILRLYLGERGFEGCRRSDFLEEIVQHIPNKLVEFDKEVIDVVDVGDNEKLRIIFRDGTSAEADVGKCWNRICVHSPG